MPEALDQEEQRAVDTLRATAREFIARGPGFAQQSVVLREAARRLNARDLEEVQRLLDVWHRLFRDGEFVWGYDLDNPSAPFFHLPR